MEIDIPEMTTIATTGVFSRSRWLQEKKSEEKSKSEEERLQEQRDFDADAAFLKALTSDCEEKAAGTCLSRGLLRGGLRPGCSSQSGKVASGRVAPRSVFLVASGKRRSSPQHHGGK